MTVHTASSDVVHIGKTKTLRPNKPPADHMSWIPGGTFTMGSNDHYPEVLDIRSRLRDSGWTSSP
ncbi:MAG TPA: hypothetical protein VL866_06240 [Pyrinomonadaceae bacterium]|nr:hypothetical protein [Pyrinomonadaceae bacterium]